MFLSVNFLLSYPKNVLPFDNYQLLHQYHKILAACKIRGERACEFSFNIAQTIQDGTRVSVNSVRQVRQLTTNMGRCFWVLIFYWVTQKMYSRLIIISYCINTTKYWLRAIFKENELASSPLILPKANILWYWCNNCFIVWLKVFDFVNHQHMSRDKIFCCKICRIILRRLFLGMKVKVNACSVL